MTHLDILDFGGLAEPATLAPEDRGGDQGVAADGGGLRGVASERATDSVRLPGSDERKIDCAGQAAGSQAGRGGRNSALTYGKMRLVGDGARSHGDMWDVVAGGRGGSGKLKGGYTICASYGHITPRSRTGGFSSFIRGTHSTRKTRKAVLWAIRNEWPSGTRFTFNCCRHWYTLVVRDTEDWSGHFSHSKEGVTQGDPLSMITYGIGVLPLIRELWDAHPRISQPWYSDDAGAGGSFRNILVHFKDLQVRGPPWRYSPEPTESILVVALRNVARSEEFFRGMGMKVVDGRRYLGGFISDRDAETTWLDKKVQGWEESVRTLSGVARKHQQSAYYGLKKSLQQEWEFMQRVTPDIGYAFGPVEKALRDSFMPALF